jgi:hypothetical protein
MLKIKENITGQVIIQIGKHKIIFDPSIVKQQDYQKYKDFGFDIFDEVEEPIIKPKRKRGRPRKSK